MRILSCILLCLKTKPAKVWNCSARSTRPRVTDMPGKAFSSYFATRNAPVLRCERGLRQRCVRSGVPLQRLPGRVVSLSLASDSPCEPWIPAVYPLTAARSRTDAPCCELHVARSLRTLLLFRIRARSITRTTEAQQQNPPTFLRFSLFVFGDAVNSHCLKLSPVV